VDRFNYAELRFWYKFFTIVRWPKVASAPSPNKTMSLVFLRLFVFILSSRVDLVLMRTSSFIYFLCYGKEKQKLKTHQCRLPMWK